MRNLWGNSCEPPREGWDNPETTPRQPRDKNPKLSGFVSLNEVFVLQLCIALILNIL